MGVILFGGAQYSLPEQANLTLIFSPKIVDDLPTIILQNFPDLAKKIHVIFADTKIFVRHIKIFQKSLCFSRISQ
jgi:hypothetical protein